MKYTKFIAVGVICAVVPSCSLAQRAMLLPVRFLSKAVGLVSNEEVPKTEVEKQEEEAAKIY